MEMRSALDLSRAKSARRRLSMQARRHAPLRGENASRRRDSVMTSHYGIDLPLLVSAAERYVADPVLRRQLAVPRLPEGR